MIRFHQTFGAHAGRTYEFDQDLVRFGRQPDCEVAFDPQADLDASGRHAEVRREGGQYIVVDSGSRNGTWVNGHRVQTAGLSTGDEVEFGHGGPRVRVELVHFQSSAMMTGPMTPAGPGQPTGAATPIPVGYLTPPGPALDASGPTMAGTPIPGGRGLKTPAGFSAAVTPLQGGFPGSVPAAPHAPGGAMPPPADLPPLQSGGAGGPAPGGGPRAYGEKTVGMMIQSAVSQARADGQGPVRSTAFLRAIAGEAASHSSRKLKVAVGVLSVLFLLSMVAIVVLFVVNLQEAERNRRQNEQLQTQIGQQGPAGPRIAAAYERAVYMLVEQQAGGERGVCSAFAVRPDLLATNAHCVVVMEQRGAQGATFQAMQNGAPGERHAILQMWRHPGYVSGGDRPSADVGIVRIGGQAPVQVVLANMQQLSALRAGTEVLVFGFPGDLADVSSPVATITAGVVGRLTAFDGTATDPAQSHLIQHSAFTSAGTSGSPIFDQSGVVVAINAGTFRSAQNQEVVGPLGPQSQTVVTESGYKYGVRIDLLISLLAGMGR